MVRINKMQESIKNFFEKPCDFRDVFVERRSSTGIFFTLSKVKQKSSLNVSGAGFRTVSGDFNRYQSTILTDDVEELLIKNGVDLKLRSVSAGFDLDTFGEFLAEIDGSMREAGKDKVKNIDFSFSLSDSVKGIWNGKTSVTSASSRAKFFVEVITSSPSAQEIASEHLITDKPLGEHFLNSCREKSFRALSVAVALLDAKNSPAGNFPVVISAEAGGTFIHEAIGHSLEADAVRYGISPVYAGKINERVASSEVTVIDDPTLAGKNGSYDYDDEGVAPSRTVLIEKGILKNYLLDRKEAGFLSLDSNGHGRRESYKFKPIPRMGVTFLAPGNSDLSEMMKKINKGILIRKMGGGQVNPANGDFVFEVSEGYLIENGKKKALLKRATVAGNGPEILKNLKYVGGETGWDDGTCGKNGQGVAVTDGMPATLIENVIVGGR